MSKAKLELLRQILVCAMFIGLAFWLLPGLTRPSDEANFIATALKMKREVALVAASHREEDILRHGRDHKPTKMPGYMLALIAWLTVVPDPDLVRLLNLSLFGISVLLLYRFAMSRSEGGRPPWWSILAMLSIPSGLAYSNTAMSEAFVLFVGVVHFLSWYGRPEPRLWWFYLSAFMGFATKETLALLTLSIMAVNAGRFRQLHVDLWRRSRGGFGGVVALVLVLVLVGLELLRDRGFYPNFRTSLLDADGIGTVLAMIWQNAINNMEEWLRFSRFPHHYLHGYQILTFAMSVALTVWARRRPEFRFLLMLTVFWSISLLAVVTLYRTQQFHAQRVFQLCSLLTLAAWYVQIPKLVAGVLKHVLLIGPVVLQLFLAYEVNDFFIFERSTPVARAVKRGAKGPHYLTEHRLVREGTVVMAELDAGYRVLAENQHAELIILENKEPERLTRLIQRGRPDLVVLTDGMDLKPLGYTPIAANRSQAPGKKAEVTIIYQRAR